MGKTQSSTLDARCVIGGALCLICSGQYYLFVFPTSVKLVGLVVPLCIWLGFHYGLLGLKIAAFALAPSALFKFYLPFVEIDIGLATYIVALACAHSAVKVRRGDSIGAALYHFGHLPITLMLALGFEISPYSFLPRSEIPISLNDWAGPVILIFSMFCAGFTGRSMWIPILFIGVSIVLSPIWWFVDYILDGESKRLAFLLRAIFDEEPPNEIAQGGIWLAYSFFFFRPNVAVALSVAFFCGRIANQRFMNRSIEIANSSAASPMPKVPVVILLGLLLWFSSVYTLATLHLPKDFKFSLIWDNGLAEYKFLLCYIIAVTIGIVTPGIAMSVVIVLMAISIFALSLLGVKYEFTLLPDDTFAVGLYSSDWQTLPVSLFLISLAYMYTGRVMILQLSGTTQKRLGACNE